MPGEKEISYCFGGGQIKECVWANLTGRPCRLSKYSRHFCRLVFSVVIWKWDISCTYRHSETLFAAYLWSTDSLCLIISLVKTTTPTLRYLYVCGEHAAATLTLMLSGRPSSRLLSFSLLVIMLTVSSTFGSVLPLLLSCCSSVPVSAASLWSVLVLHRTAEGLEPPCPLRPQSTDCVNLSSESNSEKRVWIYHKVDLGCVINILVLL